ncbi:MAG: glycoside hydrolase family 3 C-terminal domain-containing protein [Bacteroidaceae bacterium]|nr:glycoside hydrolase family 3 C-terminal domain-containing protein [Bacteroidaceae bacterium]
MKKVFFSFAVASMVLASCNSSSELKLNENNIDEIVAAMTLEEKAQLIIGVGMPGVDVDKPVIGASDAGKVPGAAGFTATIERLGIPAIALCDGPAGLRISPTREGDEQTYYCTHFPIGTLLASTWDVELVKNVGAAMGNEVLEYGGDVLLAPAMNIHRNPLCGRNFEYYSEDPVVAGKIAAAYIGGIQSQGVGTSLKHFAFNSQETNRMGNNALIAPRAIREIYLRGFEIAIKEAKPWTVMSSYNYVNSTYTSESHELLTDILRGDWGYKGTVMTDWFGGADGAAQVRAGNDMLQPGRQAQYDAIIKGVQDGTLSMEDVDTSVKRILQLIVISPTFKGYQYSNKPDLKAHAEVTRQSATEGMVLLENNGALPLKEVKKVAVFGNTAYNWIAGGTGSGDVNRAYTINLLDGLKNAGYEANEDLKAAYEKWFEDENKRNEAANAERAKSWLPKLLPVEMNVDAAVLAEQAKTQDVALIAIGRLSGEGSDRPVADFDLNEAEKTLIKNVTAAFHAQGKKAVVVLNIGGVIETASWKNIPDAILCAWQGGQEGGNSVADVLSGKANPSGKLTMTWPVKFADHASSKNFPIDKSSAMLSFNFGGGAKGEGEGEKDVDYTKYEEGIYVGYRWFDSQKMNVSYPFGYGLSYTTFEYSNAAVKAEGENITVTVDVKNTGAVDGKEIVELYAVAPAGNMDKPAQELKAFAKTKALKPGETATVTLKFNAADLASFDEDQNAWVVDAGTYTLKVGASSRDIKAELTTEVAAKTTPVSKGFAKK